MNVYIHLCTQDILTSRGFLRFLWAAMNLKGGALLVAGILCSTWSVVNRSLAGIRPQFSLLMITYTHTHTFILYKDTLSQSQCMIFFKYACICKYG